MARRSIGRRALGLAVACALLLGGCWQPPRRVTFRPAPGTVMEGRASWYGPRYQGRRTASGERFDMGALTAAHREWAFGTLVRVTRLSNGRSVVVRINDRGPYARGRIVDLSRAAARVLGMLRAGHALVRLEVLGPRGEAIAVAAPRLGVARVR